MSVLDDALKLPDDPADLKGLVTRLASELKNRDLKIAKLEHELLEHRRHRFGPKSETMDQLALKPEVSLPRRVGPPYCLGKRRTVDGKQASETGGDCHEASVGWGARWAGHAASGCDTADRCDRADILSLAQE